MIDAILKIAIFMMSVAGVFIAGGFFLFLLFAAAVIIPGFLLYSFGLRLKIAQYAKSPEYKNKFYGQGRYTTTANGEKFDENGYKIIEEKIVYEEGDENLSSASARRSGEHFSSTNSFEQNFETATKKVKLFAKKYATKLHAWLEKYI